LLSDFLADVGQWRGRCNGGSDDHG
jgi:hypothetical protein